MNDFLNDFKFFIGAIFITGIILVIPVSLATYFKSDWWWLTLILSFPIGTSIARKFLKN